MNNNHYLQVIKGDKRCPRGRGEPIISKAQLLRDVYPHTPGERDSSHIHSGNIMTIDFKWSIRKNISTHLLPRLIYVPFLFFYLPSTKKWYAHTGTNTHNMNCAQLPQKRVSTAFVSAGGPDTTMCCIVMTPPSVTDLFSHATHVAHARLTKTDGSLQTHHANWCACVRN